jgi:hypothetical protein
MGRNERSGFHVWLEKPANRLCVLLKNIWRFSRRFSNLDFSRRVRWMGFTRGVLAPRS